MVRLSGQKALAVGAMLAGTLPVPRQAALRRLRDASGANLDDALVIAFPGPATATGEDLLELHLHGGRAVVRAVLDVLAATPGLRAADAGEFTRRALANGRIDLAEAEGLADLLAAESELARRAALVAAEGGVSRTAAAWGAQLLALSARLEAQIDFADEDDLPAEAAELDAIREGVADLVAEVSSVLAAPAIERLRDGFRIVLAGPPNAGKSSLINVMTGRDVAIASAIAGTTRDRLEAPVLRDGIGYILTDTAGLIYETDDPIERIGVSRATDAIDAADLVIWLGDEEPALPNSLAIHARSDEAGRTGRHDRLSVSATTGDGVAALWRAIAEHCARLLPPGDAVIFNTRQRGLLAAARDTVQANPTDPILLAESLRLARSYVDAITGTTHIEAMLDDLFGRFCIGK